jgi:DNA-binding protein HU-beta
LYYSSRNQLFNDNELNTKEFIQALGEKLGVSRKEASLLLEECTGAIRECLSEDKKITIMHLGSFQVKTSASRSAYLPALDKKALVPPRRSIQFTPAESLRDKLKNTPER